MPAPVIVLVNSYEPSILQDIQKIGADLCISKPLLPRKFMQEMNRFFLNTPIAPIEPFKAPPPLPIKQMRKTKILVAEDNPANLQLICVLLEQIQAQVITTGNGKGALEMANQEHFDLILLDLQMPLMNGIESAERIRHESQYNRETPIILITAHITEMSPDTLQQYGINELILKPIDIKQLYDLIGKWLKKPTPTRKGAEKPVLDLEKGLAITGGKQELAEEMLMILLTEIPNFQAQTKQALEQNNAEALAETLHKFKGACSYCGVPKLLEVVTNFESAAIKHQTGAFAAYEDELSIEILALQKACADLRRQRTENRKQK
jgi:two-component system sensor histidine kinase BarA